MTENKFFEFAQDQIKDLLGAVWDENKDEAKSWIEAVAKLQVEIIRGETPETTEQTKKHIEFGLKCFKRKLLGRVEDKTVETVGNIFSAFLNLAIETGKAFLVNKLGDNKWQV